MRTEKAGWPRPTKRRALVVVEEVPCAWCGDAVPIRVVFRSGAEIRRHKSRSGTMFCRRPACRMAYHRARKRGEMEG